MVNTIPENPVVNSLIDLKFSEQCRPDTSDSDDLIKLYVQNNQEIEPRSAKIELKIVQVEVLADLGNLSTMAIEHLANKI